MKNSSSSSALRPAKAAKDLAQLSTQIQTFLAQEHNLNKLTDMRTPRLKLNMDDNITQSKIKEVDESLHLPELGASKLQ